MSIADELMNQIDGLFNTLDSRKFENQVVNETPYEAEGMGNGNIQPVSFLQDGSIDDIAAYAASIRPPAVVDTLPVLPDTDYPEGTYAFLTTTSVLYVNVADVWTEEDGSTITNGILIAGLVRAAAISTEQLAADAVIANVANVGNTVVIDSTGITILDGVLTFEDEFGQTVLSGAGFGATWTDFLDSHVYNHSFRAGTTNDITAVTEVSGGDTDADYAASISDDIPYWVVDVESGSGTFKRVADTDAVSGFALQWDGDENAEIYQDIPISPGQVYSTYLTWKYNCDAGSSSFFSTVGCQFRDKTHGAITGEVVVEQSLLFNTDQSTYITEGMNWSGTAPATARYLRVFIAMTRNAGTPTVKVAAVNVDPINVYGPQRVIQGTTAYDNGYGIAWYADGGATTDIALVRSGTTTLKLTQPLGTGGTLHIDSQDNQNLSANGGLVIGPTSGTNLSFDANDIQARNNGGANDLQIQRLGGNTVFNTGADTVTITAGGNIKMDDGYVEMLEIASVPGGSANTVRIYVDDSGGTTRLRAVGPGGVRVTLATF